VQNGIRGITSNPAIFEKAISGSQDYNKDIMRLSDKQSDEIFFELAITDIQDTTIILQPVSSTRIPKRTGRIF